MDSRIKCHRIFFALLALVMTGVFCCGAKRSTWDDDARRRKASYLYIEAVNAFMAENYNLYAELLTRAHNLDPDDPEIVSRLGEWILIANQGDSLATETAFKMIFDGYSQKPADYFEGSRIVNLTNTYRRYDDNVRASEILASQFPDRNEVKLQLGRSYMVKAMMGDTSYIPKALSVISSLEERVGKSSSLSALKVVAYGLKTDTAAIIDELSSLYASSPNDPYTLMGIGQIYSTVSRPDSALHYLDLACELDSTNGNALLMRAQLYQRQGDSIAFEREALRAVGSADLEFEAKVEFIVNYINTYSADSGQHQKIDNLFETLVDVNTGEPDVYRLYAEYLSHIGNNASAAEQMEYFVSLVPSDRDGWIYMASLYANDKQYDKAAGVLERGEENFPGDFGFPHLRGLYLTLADDNETAIRVLENIPDSVMTNPEALAQLKTMRGDVYYKLKRKDDAFREFEGALKIDPFNYTAKNNVAYYYALNDTLLDRADDYARSVVRHDPDNLTSLDTYAWVKYKKGEYKEARELADKILSVIRYKNTIDSIDKEIDKVVPDEDSEKVDADISYKGTTEEVAENIAEEEYDPNVSLTADVFDHIGDIFYRCGEIDKAVEYWKKALDYNPENPDEIKLKIKHKKITDNAP